MSIVTKRGDSGVTDRLFGGQMRKDSWLLDAIGNLDELNAYMGLAAGQCGDEHLKESIAKQQSNLVSIMGELSASDHERYMKGFSPISHGDIESIETLIYEIEKDVSFDDWQTPSTHWDVACRICRRAERSLWTFEFASRLENKERPREEILIYINRLSDYLWILGRDA